MNNKERIAVIGLGYVGLPVALAFASKFANVIGYDIDEKRVTSLNSGDDWTGECSASELRSSTIVFSSDPKDLEHATFYVVAVPTPIDENRQPDLISIQNASRMVGATLKSGDLVVYESTVYPGVTEEVCASILSEKSGLFPGKDFHLAYSPERVNPGDKNHTIEKIVKVVAGDSKKSQERAAAAYSEIISAGIHLAPSIKVAEAAKVIENTQRDLNIALMNELSLIFDRLGIRTRDVLEAAATKWNFLPFSPGLVGGHCIGVDPYYLTAKAQAVGYNPEVILAGRRINDKMGTYIAQRIVKLLTQQVNSIRNARVGILGLTFKENVPDLRNSKVPDIVTELTEFGLDVLVHDPLANAEEVDREFSLSLFNLEDMQCLDGLLIAVAHDDYRQIPTSKLVTMLNKTGIIFDIKSILDVNQIPEHIVYKSL